MPSRPIPSFTRAVHLETMAGLVAKAAGPSALMQIYDDQDVSPTLIDQPGALLLRRDYIGLYLRAAQVMEVQSLGLVAGASCKFSRLGPYGRYVSAAPSLLEALVRARDTVRFHESSSTFNFERAGDDIKIYYQCIDQNMIGWRHLADMCLCLLRDIVRHFLGNTWQPQRIEVSYQQGPWRHSLEENFDASIEFNKSVIAVFVPESALSAPNAKPGTLHTKEMLAQVVEHGMRFPINFTQAGREVVHQRLLSGRTDIEGAAIKLGLTPRTFQRRLQDNGSSYRQLLSSCIADRAAELLSGTEISDVEIAMMLGYSSEPHFIRAFKRKRGITPGRFRRVRNGAQPVH